jgi:D-serine deaminase-like pyridoxal phosphate-dependent protein
MRTMEERHAAIEGAAQHVFEMKRLLQKAGIACPIVTGAGSGTYMLEVEAGAWDEIQPGSYIFMDVDYAKNEWAAPLPRFEHALFVLATVMSRPAADRAIVDAGLKASSVDSGLPLVWRREGLTYRGASDEHGVIEVAAGAQAPALGDKLYLVPGHCDPTVNLYDWYVCVRKGRVETVWSVTARGALN